MSTPKVLEKVRGLIAQADLESAERILRKALHRAPDFYLYHARLGDVLALQNRPEAARACYARALKQNPQARWIKARQDRPEALLTPAAARQNTDGTVADRSLHLYLPFYTPSDSRRAAELHYCLDRNLACDAFADITLLVDDDTALPQDDPRLRVIRLTRRPSYLDWVREARIHSAGQIAVLANSDIHFGEDVTRLREIFDADRRSFVALSRFEKTGDTLTPHPNPQWSQDTWAFCPDAPPHQSDTDADIRDRLFDLPMGVPRCDNKIAYVFSIRGYTLRNPVAFVTSVHVHESGLRDYDKTGDRRIIGGMAMVHPSPALTAPSALDFEIWSISSTQIASLSLNKRLETWDRQRRIGRRPPIVMHDADWQYPAITEQYAFEMMRRHLPEDGEDHRNVYLGFPFATLIDLKINGGKANKRRAVALQAELDRLAARLRGCERVVTVCQHIHMRRCGQLFAAAGITDVFWSHCRAGETGLADAPGVSLHPFPLYPVQRPPASGLPRTILYSFVGARENQSYLTGTRSLILETLKDEPRGRVIIRDTWHYNAVVYDHQILNLADADASLPDESAAAEFRAVMNASVFTLCPSGSGPNSIRLWEAVVNGSIPVVLADTYQHPGPADLWQAAVVTCAETADAIAALPDRLAAIAADPEHLARKRAALRELANRYGPGNFVPDVLALLGTAKEDGEGKQAVI